MLVACLWPFDFNPSNKAHWLAKEPGVRFAGMGCVVSRETFPPLPRLSSDGSLTVEIAVRPTRLTDRYVSHILTFHPSDGPAPLVIGSWKNSALVRVGRRGGTGGRPFREVGARNAFAAGVTTVVTTVAGSKGTSLYLNGRLQRSAPNAVIERGSTGLGKLLLGISPYAGGWWRGDILGLKIYNRALSESEVLTSHEAYRKGTKLQEAVSEALIAEYGFREGLGNVAHDTTGNSPDLTIPREFRPLRRTFLSPPGVEARWSRSVVWDIALNIVGFIPYAFLAAWFLRTRAGASDRWKATAVVLSGFLLSLTVELVQGFLPTRSSSLVDLCTNTVGTAIGVVLFHALGTSSDVPYLQEGTRSSG